MTTSLRLRRGTTTQHSTFTGGAGEVTVDTTKKTVVVHDGTTVGGTPVAREDLSNVPNGAVTTAKIADSNVTAVKIADANVTTAKIADGNVTTAKIADGSVTGSKLENSGVTANTYGSSSAIPVLTVDGKGRVTGASTAAVSTGLGGISIMTSSGSFTIPAGVTKVRVTVIGAGGGANTFSNNNANSGAGGGTAIKLLTGLTPGGTLSVTVGAVGTNNGGTQTGFGGTGGTSSVSSGTSNTISTISATGGGGGQGIGTGSQIVGGTGSGGDINLKGTQGSGNLSVVQYNEGGQAVPTWSSATQVYYTGGCCASHLFSVGSGFGFGTAAKSTTAYTGGAGAVIFEW